MEPKTDSIAAARPPTGGWTGRLPGGIAGREGIPGLATPIARAGAGRLPASSNRATRRASSASSCSCLALVSLAKATLLEEARCCVGMQDFEAAKALYARATEGEEDGGVG